MESILILSGAPVMDCSALLDQYAMLQAQGYAFHHCRFAKIFCRIVPTPSLAPVEIWEGSAMEMRCCATVRYWHARLRPQRAILTVAYGPTRTNAAVVQRESSARLDSSALATNQDVEM